MKINSIKSPNHSQRKRSKKKIEFIIIHYTGMQSERASIKRLVSSKSKVSTHYLINRDGEVVKMVDENRVAWHAGKSKWKHFNKLNSTSIGIELVNKGHQFGYQSFPKAQIQKLVLLLKTLVKKYKIKNTNILGHSDIAPLRKIDPGEKFPWNYLIKNKIVFKYSVNKNIDLMINNKKNYRSIFFKNLYKIGYRYFNQKKSSKFDSKIIKTFQRRYRQNKIDGLIDRECINISYNVANSMKN